MDKPDNQKLISIIAPPRTCSTLVLALLSNNHRVKALHEPEKEFKSYSEGKKTFEVSKRDFLKRYDAKEEILVAKNMSQWMTIDPWICDYIISNSNEILVLIRYPHLAFESKIRKHLESFLLKNGKQDLQKVQYAKEILFNNNSEYLQYLDTIFGKELVFGWKELEQIVKEMDRRNIQYTVLDTTILRSNHNECLPELQKRFNLPYELTSNINWSKIEASEEFKMQNKPYQKNWYDRISSSKIILPPIEKVRFDYNKYPKYILKDLEEAIQIYSDLKLKTTCI